MSVRTEWNEFMPRAVLHAGISAGQLTLISSTLANYADYDWTNSEVRGTIWKNGDRAGELAISSSTGAVTMSALSVAQGDEIELRFQFLGSLSAPWFTQCLLRRSAFLTVPSGSETFDFDADDNTQPVPAWDMAFGWDGNENFKVGVVVDDDDGASQDIDLVTKLYGACPDSSSSGVLDLDTSSTQTFTSSFDFDDVDLAWALEMTLQSASGTPRQQDRITLVFMDVNAVQGYPASFPATGVMLRQTKTGSGTLELDPA